MNELLRQFYAIGGIRRWIILGFGVLVIIIILLFAIFPPRTSKPKENVGEFDNNESSLRDKPSFSPAVTPSQIPANINYYNDEDFSIQYPLSAIKEERPVLGGGKYIRIINSSDGQQYEISIYKVSSKDQSADALSSVLLTLGYVKKGVSINKVPASEFSYASNGIRERAVVFENNGSTYEIKLSYAPEVIQPLIESAFLIILSSFKFTSQ